MTGSENFDVHLWKVPSVGDDSPGTTKVLTESSIKLSGHRSVVNQVVFNRETGLLCSSGVEKVIKFWSPFPLVGGITADSVEQKREMYTREDYNEMVRDNRIYHQDDGTTNENRDMLIMVDNWIRNAQRKKVDGAIGEPGVENIGVLASESRGEDGDSADPSPHSDISPSTP